MTERGNSDEILARRRKRNRERQAQWRKKVGIIAVRQHDRVRRQNVKTLQERLGQLEERVGKLEERQ